VSAYRTVTIPAQDGRVLRAYDTGPTGRRDGLAVMWHHGTPNVGAPPAPLVPAAERLGLRWISYDRPGYGGSSPRPDRDIASAAADARRVADGLDVDRFAVMGHSGGCPHALACAALLPGRVPAVVNVAGLAPFGADGLDWFAGMAPGGVASLHAAVEGRAAKERFEAAAVEGDLGFTAADLTALAGEWSWFEEVVRPAVAAGPGGLIDDDLAYVRPWGFGPAQVAAPVLLMHGGQDRVVPASHSRWLARHLASAELRLSPQDGHISVLVSAAAALRWLRAHAA
jgi:pimeloyl-ACP methyl ester carboxylesterase